MNTPRYRGPVRKTHGPTRWRLQLGLALAPVSSPRRRRPPDAGGGAPGRRSPIIGSAPPAMEKGKGLARRWAVELHSASSSSPSPAVPDPPGFTRSAPDAVNPYSSPRSSVLWFALYPGIHVLALARRTTPRVRASGRTQRPHGRRRFVRSLGPICVFCWCSIDPGRGQCDFPR